MQRIQYLAKDFKGLLVADLLQISARLCNLFNPELFRPASRPPRTDPGTAARASAPRNDTMRIQTETAAGVAIAPRYVYGRGRTRRLGDGRYENLPRLVAARRHLPDLSALLSGQRTATASAICRHHRAARLPRRGSASTRSGSRRSIPRRWPTSATTSPTTATSIRSSARWPTSTALLAAAHARGLKRHPRLRARTTPPTSIPGSSRVALLARQPEARLVHLARPGARTAGRRTTGSANSAARAWDLDAATGQYYYHAFLHAAARPELAQPGGRRRRCCDVLRFWLDRGVDGFRVDAIHHLIKDAQLPRQSAQPRLAPGR